MVALRGSSRLLKLCRCVSEKGIARLKAMPSSLPHASRSMVASSFAALKKHHRTLVAPKQPHAAPPSAAPHGAAPHGAARTHARLCQGRERLTLLAACFGRLATAGVRSPVARLGSPVILRLSAAGLGLAMVAGFVPFAFELARHSGPFEAAPSADAETAGARHDGVQKPAPQKPSLFDSATTGSTESWSRVVKPMAIFGVPAPELAGLPQRYEALRHSGGGRDDRLVFGEFAPVKNGNAAPGFGSHVHLSFLRPASLPEGKGAEKGIGTGADKPRAFIIDLVRQTADLGLDVERTQQPTVMPTKFGPFEVADVAMQQGQHQRACLAFRFADEGNPLRMAGWWCGAGGKPADRRQLSCMIDRIDLLNAGEDRNLRAMFTMAEKARDKGCSAPRMAMAGRKASWLDPEMQAPSLRNSHQAPARN